MGFSRQEYWSGLPFPSPGDLPNPGIEPGSPTLQADALSSEPPGKPFLVGGRYCFLNSLRVLCSYNIAWIIMAYLIAIRYISWHQLYPLNSVSDNENQKHFVESMYLKKSKNKRCKGNVLTRSSRQLYIHSVSATGPRLTWPKTKNVHYWVVIYWIHREGNGNPFQYSCLEKSHGQWSVMGYGPWSQKELDTTNTLHPTSLKFNKSCSFFPFIYWILLHLLCR